MAEKALPEKNTEMDRELGLTPTDQEDMLLGDVTLLVAGGGSDRLRPLL